LTLFTSAKKEFVASIGKTRYFENRKNYELFAGKQELILGTSLFPLISDAKIQDQVKAISSP
jgi:hypothetical protein